MNKKLYRDEYHKTIGGVCAGLAEYFDIDISIMRLVFVFSTFAGGAGIVAYIVLWIVLPKKGYQFNNFSNPTVDYTVPPQQDDQFNTLPPPYKDVNYQYNPYASEPYSGSETKQPFTGYVPPRKKSNAGVIFGMILIIIGVLVLIDNFDLIPDFDFWRISPVILVFIGAALLVSGRNKVAHINQEWDSKATQQADTTEAKAADVPPASEL